MRQTTLELLKSELNAGMAVNQTNYAYRVNKLNIHQIQTSFIFHWFVFVSCLILLTYCYNN